MTETPRMPNFWWCPTHHLYRGGTERPRDDAVKLGDVDALRAEIRAVLADFHHCGPRLPMTMLQQIDDIVEREANTRCVNDTNGDGDCAACAHNPNAPCRQPSVLQPSSETDWGNWLPREQRVIKADDEADARRTAHVEGWPLRQRRAAGPWVEVQP